MRVGQISHRGNVRFNNEDKVYSSQKRDLFIIADGMGGHKGGEIASKYAIEKVKYYIRNKSDKYGKSSSDILKLIKDAICYANKSIYNLSQKDNSLAGMGTTIITVFIHEKTAYIGHVGDSRLYLINGKSLTQITTDHSLVQELFNSGKITKEELANYPHKNIITRALGYSDKISIDTYSVKLNKNDILLLCTDGLSNMISDKEIFNIMLSFESPQKCAKTLVELANEYGGKDNVSVIVAKSVG